MSLLSCLLPPWARPPAARKGAQGSPALGAPRGGLPVDARVMGRRPAVSSRDFSCSRSRVSPTAPLPPAAPTPTPSPPKTGWETSPLASPGCLHSPARNKPVTAQGSVSSQHLAAGPGSCPGSGVSRGMDWEPQARPVPAPPRVPRSGRSEEDGMLLGHGTVHAAYILISY